MVAAAKTDAEVILEAVGAFVHDELRNTTPRAISLGLPSPTIENANTFAPTMDMAPVAKAIDRLAGLIEKLLAAMAADRKNTPPIEFKPEIHPAKVVTLPATKSPIKEIVFEYDNDGRLLRGKPVRDGE